jgi:hypothetical protein
MPLTTPPLAGMFLDFLDRRVSPPARTWLAQATAHADVPFDDEAFTGSFIGAARRLGRTLVALEPEENERLRALGIDWPLSGWSLDELGRVTLLVLAAAHLSEAALKALVEECYQHGENRERQAVLCSLPLLPQAERFLTLAVDACRTNIQPIFEAIACENPYPAAYFPELHFNQMVLKALFIGVAVRRIVGLERRITLELTRMAKNYASERKAAGRSIPSDISYLTEERRSLL